MAAELVSPYLAEPGAIWLRGNLHMHTQRSDGRDTPQAMIDRYAEAGYDFLALSDHDTLGTFDDLDARGMVLLPANEVCGGYRHMLHIGARSLVNAGENLQQTIDAIVADGGLAILCHPNWQEQWNHYPYELLAGLKGYSGIEIFNGVCLEQPGSHLAVDKWERLLASGKSVWGFANDDAHRLGQTFRAWNVVRAAARSQNAILDALRCGSFYASTGVEITEISARGAILTVKTRNADRLAVFGEGGVRLAIVDGAELVFDAGALDTRFFRVECYGRGGDCAWTQPIGIRGGELDQRVERFEQLRPHLKALRADREITLTGSLDDPLWQQAPAGDVFLRMKTGASPDVKTEVRALASKTHLVLGFRCQEDDPAAMRLHVTRDGDMNTWSDDGIEVFLDPSGKGESYCQIMASASGFVAVGNYGLSAKPSAAVKVGRTGEGWTMELAVPLAELATPAASSVWGLHICRNRGGKGEWLVWSYVGSTNHNAAMFGKLDLA